MPKIGILEDRPEQRETISRAIDAIIGEPWAIIDVPLFPDPKKIPAWLVQHDVQVLLADYFLNEQSGGGVVEPVDYTSDIVIRHVRETMPDFPVYVMTAAPEAATVLQSAAEAEDILKRRDFTKNPRIYVKRMIRAGQRYATQFQRELAELAVLAEHIATGEATQEERDRARALQALIGLEITAKSVENRQAILEELEAKVAELENLKAEIDRKLNA